MSERVWEQTGPRSACRSRVCQLVFFLFLSSFFCFPSRLHRPPCVFKIHSSAAQLFCRSWSVACRIRGYACNCHVVIYAYAAVRSNLSVLEQLWRHLQCDRVLLFFAPEDYFLLLLSFLFWSSLIILFSLWICQLCGVLEVGSIRDLVKHGLRTGNRRGMNG